MTTGTRAAPPDTRRAEQPAERKTGPAGTRRRVVRRPDPLPWLLPLGVLGMWQLASWNTWMDPLLLPSPGAVARVLWDSARDGTLGTDLSASTERWASGFLIGASLGLLLGSLVGLSTLSERLLDTSVQMLRTVPVSGLSPLLIVWLGLDEAPKVVLVAVGSFFPVYINTFGGIRNVDRKLIEVGRVFQWNRPTVLRRIVLPAALPEILNGIRYALGVAWVLLVLAELLGATSGLGFMLNQGRELSRVDVVIAALLVFAVAGKAVDLLVRAAERRLLRWRDLHTGA
ncbi:ABC transporter permease [Streptomyces sp. NPDC059590]|uniref:ABC transporter permease n=1 Tax=Streptomyces sp. NPDC059590 TaxID=3346877 RepID=UPI0036880B2B